MLCEKCKVNTATTHIKTNINGISESHNLCARCAAEQGYTQSHFGLGVGQLLGSLFGESSSPVATRCPVCGASFDEIAASGKVGCDNCYELFLDRLVPSIERMHGRSNHIGKRPLSNQHIPTATEQIAKLREQLQQAVEQQEFERAAELRDQIKKMESENND